MTDDARVRRGTLAAIRYGFDNILGAPHPDNYSEAELEKADRMTRAILAATDEPDGPRICPATGMDCITCKADCQLRRALWPERQARRRR